MIAETLIDKIEKRETAVGILGLGFVGLSLAVTINKAGHTVNGYDINTAKAATLEQGKSYVTDVPDDELKRAFSTGRFRVRSDFANIAENDIFIIAVQTNIDAHNVPVFEPLKGACREVASGFRGNQLVVIESTIYPGVLEESILPCLERHGQRVGRDFLIAASPERIDPGNKEYPLSKIPKMVGGFTPESRKVAIAFYETFIDKVIPVENDKVALLAKLLENTYRSVNIALINELTMIADKLDVDIWEVVEAASTKPYGFMPFTPSPGAGGSCIPVDPLFLVWKIEEMDEHAEFIELATKINEKVPKYMVKRITLFLNDNGYTVKGTKMLLIGVAYKPDIADLSHTPAVPVTRLLLEADADVTYYDPFIPEFNLDGISMTSEKALTPELVREADLVVILTNHGGLDYDMIRKNAKLIFDGRNQYKGIEAEKIRRL